MEKETFYSLVAKNKLYETLPMPMEFYKLYDIKPPEPMEFKDCLKTHLRAMASVGQATETRPPAEGGVRPVDFKEYKLELLETVAEEAKADEPLSESVADLKLTDASETLTVNQS